MERGARNEMDTKLAVNLITFKVNTGQTEWVTVR